jgi:hypothetical protein
VPDAVEANARLTGSMGAALLVVFAAEGLTILFGVRSNLSAHVFLGVLAVPPIAVKLACTGHRFLRYYRGDPRYVRKGPPPWLLRVLGPLVIATTVAVVATGIADLLLGPSHGLTRWHKLSFFAWFAAMTIHVLGHLVETPALATADWRRPTRALTGSLARRMVVVGTLVAGTALALWSLGWVPAVWSKGLGG